MHVCHDAAGITVAFRRFNSIVFRRTYLTIQGGPSSRTCSTVEEIQSMLDDAARVKVRLTIRVENRGLNMSDTV
jgi:hypothetical protein